MNTNRPLGHVPRRALNAAVIVGGIVGIILQSRFGWGVLTTFLITLILCALSVSVLSVIFYIKRT